MPKQTKQMLSPDEASLQTLIPAASGLLFAKCWKDSLNSDVIADPTQTQPPLESFLTNYPKNCGPNLLRDTIQFHIAMSISPFACKFLKNCMDFFYEK